MGKGAVDATTVAEEDKLVTHMVLSEPFVNKEGRPELTYRKTIAGIRDGNVIVECKGGCEGTDYIKLQNGVKNATVCSF